MRRNLGPANGEAPKEPSKMHHIKPRINKKDGKQRSGRGFSPQELRKSGLSLAEAKKLEIPADKRRTTVHDWNVKILKAYVKKVKTEVKPKNKPKKKAKK